MIGGIRPKISRWLITALYVLAMASISFGSAARVHHGAGFAAATTLDVPACGHVVPNPGRPAKAPLGCCDACALSAAPIMPSQITHVICSIEIAARLEFELRLGRRLDHRPDDLRSRAPPLAA
jgi:hypothetical protein